jgi:reactive intermediate/imine deaminase
LRPSRQRDHVNEEVIMTRDARQPEGMSPPVPPYSPVVVSGDLVFVSGQVALDKAGTPVAGGIEQQVERVFDNLERCLAAAGCTLDDVVKVTAFLADLGDFPAFNVVYAHRFSAPYPARSTVGVRLAEGLLVEIEAIARRPDA